MQKSNKTFLASLLASTFIMSGNVEAQILPDVNVNLNLPITYSTDYVGLTVATPINTVSLNVSNGTFNKSLIGNKLGVGNNSNLSFTNGSVKEDLVGLQRGSGGVISNSNVINVSGGTIYGNVLATKGNDTSPLRVSNEINISHGLIGGLVEGGAGAKQNTITVTGGILNKLDDSGHIKDENDCDKDNGGGNDDSKNCKSGTIYAGVSDATVKNQSTNGTVILKDMNSSNEFLTSFTEGDNGIAGMIFGSNVTGTSEMKFDGVNGNYQGGFKDFDKVLFTEKSAANNTTNVKLTGSTYKADVWEVNGILDTNSKILSSYKNTTLALNVGATGSLTNQFISDVHVTANNSGSINGVKATNKDVVINNDKNMTGNYEGKTIVVNNNTNGVIYGNTNLTSTDTVAVSSLNNKGKVTGNLGLTGNIEINNLSGGKITNANIANHQTVLNINNSGTISDNNTITNDVGKTTNLKNLSGGIISGSLGVTNGILNLTNQLLGKISGLAMTANNAALNIANSGLINGNNSITATGTGTVKLENLATGELTGGLTVNSGLNTFTNAGNLHDLTVNNNQAVLNLTNSGLMQGANKFNNGDDTKVVNITNTANGITGSLGLKDGTLNLNNNSGGTVQNLALNSDSGVLNINNNGTMNGNNSISGVNGGTLTLANGATGDLSGGLTVNSGLNTFTNAGNLHDLTVNNNQAVLNLTNSGLMQGANKFNNGDDTKVVNITNTANGITGSLGLKDGTLNLNNNSGGTVQNLALNSDSGVLNINNNGTMNGNNSISGVNGGTLTLANGATGDLSGGLTVNSGLAASGAFTNAGTIHDLTLNNYINDLTLVNNNIINGTNVINNSTSNTGFIVDNMANGKISGSINDVNGNFTINNKTNGNLHDLTMMVSNTGNLFRVENSGLIDGNNTINVTNANGRVLIGNNSGGNITGTINNINGSDIYNHDGATIHDLIFNNSQENTGIKNYGLVKNLSLNNTDSNKYMTLFNYGEDGQGEVTGNLNVNNGTLYLASSGLIDNLNLVADNNSRVNIYNNKMGTAAETGIINGTNSFEGKNGSLIFLTNRVDGDITGTFNIKNGMTITNEGQIQDLITNNSQDVLNIHNNIAGELNGTLTFNNSDDTKLINLNNKSSDVLNGNLIVKDGTLNLNNKEGSTINGYNMIADSAILNINNDATISGTNTIENKNGGESDLNNYAGGTVTGSLALKGGTLDLSNFGGANLKDLTLKADDATINVANTGAISGSNVIENANNGEINLANNVGGSLTGTLGIKGGLESFSNAGLINDLTLNNEQAEITLVNNGLISGANAFTNTAAQIINLDNMADAGITGSLSSAGGTFNLNNKANAIISDLDYTNISSTATITNEGTINNSSLKNMLSTQMDLNNTGLISGIGDWRNVDLNNQIGGVVQSANITSIDGGVVNIANSGTFNGNNILNSADGGTFTFNNAVDGTISGGLTVNGGLDDLANAGKIENLILTSNVADFKVNNTGTVSGNNALVSVTETVTLNNTGTGTVGGNLTLNAPVVNLNQESTGAFDVALGSQNADTVLNIKNDTDLTASLAGGLKDVNLVNNNTLNADAHLTLANLGNISGSIKIDNDGYTKIDNQGTIGVGVGSGGVISDDTTPAVAPDSCLLNTVELNNSGRIDNDMRVMNNIFKLTNTATGYIDSNHIDSRDLRLSNAGIFDSDVSYLFSVQDHMNVVNSGSIYGRDMAFKLTGDKVTGTIDNTGTIYSQGTTIGYGPDPLVPCPNCYLDGDKLTINNSGKIVAVDVATLTNPDLNSYAVNGKNINFVNQTGGLVGGSLHVNDYTQQTGSTWVTFMDKDLTRMSTIFAENDISIAQGSILNIYTNNDVKAFANGQKFLLVDSAGMTQDEIDAQIENFTIRTDSPFANYQMIGQGDQGFIEFNHVAPTIYATATDLATASHNNTILGSQRMYELFVNRDVNQVQGLSSGDSFNTTNKLNFMPIGGFAHQGDKDGHAGYDTSYYGGMGYWEHDFNNNFKGGLGFAYMNNDTDFNDSDGSDGKIDSYRPFAYINYEQGAWRFDLAGGVAKHKVDNTRKYSFNNTQYHAKGKYDADEISGHLNIGYKMMLENDLVVQPMVGAYVANLKTDTFKETGSGPMNMSVKSEDYNSFKSMAGIKFSKEYELDNGASLKPELHVRWYHELGDTKGGVSAYFLAQEQLFNTSGIESPKDVGDIALRLTTKTGTEFDLFTEAYYQFGDKFYNAGGSVGIQYNF